MKEKYGAFVVRSRLTSSGSRIQFFGAITFKLGSRTLASLMPAARTGIAILDADGLRRGRNTITAFYTGDASLASTRTETKLIGE